MQPTLIFWATFFGRLGIETSLLAGLGIFLQRWSTHPKWRRTIWQGILLGSLLFFVGEIAGIRAVTSRWWIPSEGRTAVEFKVASFDFDAEKVVPISTGPTQEPSTRPMPGDIRSNWWPLQLWMLITSLLLIRIMVVKTWLAWVKNQMVVIDDQDLLKRANDLQRRLGIRGIQILAWKQLRSPIAFGMFQPTMALPTDFNERFGRSAQDAILAHEFAHLAARDPIWLMLADVVVALMWWHPAIRWVRRQFQEACESAADDASAVLPLGRMVLAELLVQLGRELSSPSKLQGIGVAGGGIQSQLGRRVQALLARSPDVGTNDAQGFRWGRYCVLALTGLLLVTPMPGGNEPLLAAFVLAIQADRPALSDLLPKAVEQGTNPVEKSAGAQNDAEIVGKGVANSEPSGSQGLTNGTRMVQLQVEVFELSEDNPINVEFARLFHDAPSNQWRQVTGSAKLWSTPGAPKSPNIRVDRVDEVGSTAILLPNQSAALMEQVKVAKGVVCLASPRVVTLSGQSASISVLQDRELVTGVDTNSTSRSTDAAIHYSTEKVALGLTTELQADLRERTTQMTIHSFRADFLGYDEPKRGDEVNCVTADGQKLIGLRPLPHFAVYQVDATAFVPLGHSVVIRGSDTAERVQTVDRVPVLSDVPLLGRLFINKSSQTRRKKTYCVVTPVELDAAGQPVKQ